MNSTSSFWSKPAQWLVDAAPPGSDADQWIRVSEGQELTARTADWKATAAAGRWVNKQLEEGRAGNDPLGFYQAMAAEDKTRADRGWNPDRFPFEEPEKPFDYSRVWVASLPGGWSLLKRLY